MGEDVSKKTIAVLLVVAILVSVVGTWVVMDEVEDSNRELASDNEESGKVSLSIGGPQLAKTSDDVGGQVRLNIK